MIQDKGLTLEQERIKKIITPVAIKHGVDKISLFGSRARGNYNEDSDYDFIISGGKIRTLWMFSSFIGDLEEALNGEVDIVTEDSAKSGGETNLKQYIEKDEVLLYER